MAVCQIQSIVNLEAHDVKQSVATYMGSLRFLKKLIPISTCNIVYNRIDLKPNLFAERDIVGVKFMVFDPKVGSRLGNDMRHWVKGAADAIEKKYLRELYMIFTDKITGNIIENYKFSFKYIEPSSCTLPPTSEEVITAMKKFLQNIQCLSWCTKLPEQTGIAIEITMIDDVPEDYSPPNFAKHKTRPLILDLPVIEPQQCLKLGTIGTGFHTVKLTGVAEFENSSSIQSDKSDTLMVMEEDNDLMDLQNSNINQKDNFEDGEKTIYSVNDENDDTCMQSVPDYEEIIYDKNLSCLCGVNVLIKSVEKVQCSVCLKYQHCPCIGYEMAAYIPNPYVCISCNSSETPATDKIFRIRSFRKDLGTVAFFRFASYYCRQYTVVPKVLLHNLAAEKRDCMFKKMLHSKFLYEEDSGLAINFTKVRSVMVNTFNQSRFSGE